MQKMRIFSIFLCFFLIGCSSYKVIGETEGGLVNGMHQIDAKKYKLKNGLTVILSQNKKLPTFAVYTFYKVGSKHEPKGMTGASHFLEHMMFKGSKNFGKGEFDRAVESNGGYSNAYTSYDQTVYYEKMPIAALDNILTLEADRMQSLLLEINGFKSEKQVVLEERKMRYENSPRGQAYVTYLNRMMKGTPYQHPVIGSIDDIKSVSRDSVFDYFKKFYAPNNAIIVISGDIDYKDTMKLINEKYGKIPASQNIPAELKEPFELSFKENKVEHFHGKSENPIFALAFPGIPYGSRQAYVGDLLSSILGGNRSSYLHQNYVETKKPILNSISAFNYTIQNAGAFAIQGEISKSISFSNFKNRLLTDLKNFCAKPITNRDLEKVKNQYLLDFYGSLETNGGIANHLGSMELYTGDFRKYVEELKIYQSITPEEVSASCKSFIVDKPHYFMTIWKKNRKKFDI